MNRCAAATPFAHQLIVSNRAIRNRFQIDFLGRQKKRCQIFAIFVTSTSLNKVLSARQCDHGMIACGAKLRNDRAGLLFFGDEVRTGGRQSQATHVVLRALDRGQHQITASFTSYA